MRTRSRQSWTRKRVVVDVIVVVVVLVVVVDVVAVVVGGTRSTRAAEEEKQWKSACSSSSSSVPSRKLRAASFKGGFCLIHIIHPGFVNSITCVQHQIKTALGERRGRNQG